MTNRIRFIDGLRGFTMLLVVYHHLCCLAFPTSIEKASVFNNVGMTFRMPLFFFISGFFLYSNNYTLQLFKKRSKNRLIKQLYPTIIIALIYCAICLDISPLAMCFKSLKCGYWFTIVSVDLFFIGATLLYFCNSIKLSKKYQILLLLLVGSAGFITSIVAAKHNLPTTDLWKLFNLYQICYFILFFFAGTIFKIAYNYASPLVGGSKTLIISVLSFGAAYYFLQAPSDTTIHMLHTLLTAFLGIVSLLSLFSIIYNKTLFSYSKAAHILEFIGKSTLEIYLLHYFFIKLLSIMPYRDAIICRQNTIYEIPLYWSITFIVVFMCLLLNRSLKITKIHKYIFPSIKKSGNSEVSQQKVLAPQNFAKQPS